MKASFFDWMNDSLYIGSGAWHLIMLYKIPQALSQKWIVVTSNYNWRVLYLHIDRIKWQRFADLWERGNRCANQRASTSQKDTCLQDLVIGSRRMNTRKSKS